MKTGDLAYYNLSFRNGTMDSAIIPNEMYPR